MRLAIIAPSVFPCPSNGYGFETNLWELASELSKYEDVTLIAPKGSKAPEKGQLMETIEPPQVWGDEEKRAYDIYKPYLSTFDIIQDESHQKYSYLANAGKPIIGVLEGVSTWPADHHAPRAGNRIISLSNWQFWDMKQRYGLDTVVVSRGVNTNRFLPLPKSDRFLYFGLMHPDKGAHIALLAASQWKKKIDMVGEDRFVPSPQYVEQLRFFVMSNDKDLRWIGAVSEQDKPKWLGEARALVLPFIKPYCYSLIAWEALSCGTPVIASNIGSFPEQLNSDVGMVVSQDGIGQAMDDMEKKPKDSQVCRRFVEKNYSMEPVARRWIDLHYQILGGWNW